MPAKNRIKTYLENAYYHLYNRGVEKRIIFLDQQDYSVFLSYLKSYLLPKNVEELRKRLSDQNISLKEKYVLLKLLALNNFADEITLLAYCLMPNHFHFLLKQKSAGAIDSFMNSLATRYTIYFNKKYKRVGALCQGVYKAVLVDSDEQLLELSRYIHTQALPNQPSSLPEYLGQRKTDWLHPQEILSYFARNTNRSLSYENFMKQSQNFEPIYKILIDNEGTETIEEI